MNYQLELDEYIKNMPCRQPLFLHSCCAPCSSYVITYLIKYFNVTVFFYNPNIHPDAEYIKRAAEQKRLCELLNIPYIEGDYDDYNYFELVKGLENEPEGGARCTECFRLRLDKTAVVAKEHGFDVICSTLTVSPHKNAPLINAIGESVAKTYGVTWLPSDFKKRGGYLESIKLSKEYNLYRQHYCGCKFSDCQKSDRP